MAVDTLPRLRVVMAHTSPLRWGLDTWAAIGGMAGFVVFVGALALCFVSFALPPMSIALLGAVLSFLIGLFLSLVVVLVVWIALVPLCWCWRWIVWRTRTAFR